MAGDYIPWVKGLSKRREVILMSDILGMSHREVAACCMEWWEWCDVEGDFDPSRDCHVKGVTFVTGLSLIGRHVSVPGFGDAMATVGWARANEEGELMHPKLGRWTGSAAKERLSARDRKRAERNNVTKMSRKKRDKNATRVEESNNPIVPYDDITFPDGMDTLEVRQAVEDWLAYKRGRGETYKRPAHQVGLLLRQFNDAGAFIAAVSHSVAQNYAGCFPSRNGDRPKSHEPAAPSLPFKN